MAVGYAFALTNGLMMWPPLPGAQVTAAILPVLIGIISGSMYAQFAGREFIARGSSDVAPAQVPDRPPAGCHLQRPGTRPQFDLCDPDRGHRPAAVFALIVIPFFSSAFDLGHSVAASDWAAIVKKLAVPSYFIVIVLMVTAIPAAIIIQVTHVLTRSMNRMRGIDYAVIGSIVSCAAALTIAGYVPLMLLLPTVAVAGALMGAIYRPFRRARTGSRCRKQCSPQTLPIWSRPITRRGKATRLSWNG